MRVGMAMLRRVRFLALGVIFASFCSVAEAAREVYSPIVPQFDSTYNEVKPSDFKELEKEARRWDNSKNIPSWARLSPEAAARRKYYQGRMEEQARQSSQQKPRPKTVDEAVADEEKRDAEGSIFPELEKAKQATLRNLAKRVVERIDWNALEKNLSRRIILVNEVGMSEDRKKIASLMEKMNELQEEAVGIIQMADYKESAENEKLVADNQQLFMTYVWRQMREAMPRSYWYKLLRFNKNCEAENRRGIVRIDLCSIDGLYEPGACPQDMQRPSATKGQ